MKIELELPDWADERNIYVFAGIEEVARKHKDAKWEIKGGRCNQCGLCCMRLNVHHPFRLENGWCQYLEREPGKLVRYRCGLKGFRPHNCAVATPQNIPECTVEYVKVE